MKSEAFSDFHYQFNSPNNAEQLQAFATHSRRCAAARKMDARMRTTMKQRKMKRSTTMTTNKAVTKTDTKWMVIARRRSPAIHVALSSKNIFTSAQVQDEERQPERSADNRNQKSVQRCIVVYTRRKAETARRGLERARQRKKVERTVTRPGKSAGKPGSPKSCGDVDVASEECKQTRKPSPTAMGQGQPCHMVAGWAKILSAVL